MKAREIVGDDCRLVIRGPMPDGGWNYCAFTDGDESR